MTEDMAVYEAALKDMRRDCDTCARPKPGTQVCPMPKLDIDTCLGNPSRPFWRPGPWIVKEEMDRARAFTNQMIPEYQPDTQDLIWDECEAIRDLLLEKNRKYGDSAIHPVRIFSKADPVAQIDVRIDDKISRIRSAQDDDTEDPELDLIGYLILKRVAKRAGVEKTDP
jgi:hypothetical protein